jgi:hypothetical protein
MLAVALGLVACPRTEQQPVQGGAPRAGDAGTVLAPTPRSSAPITVEPDAGGEASAATAVLPEPLAILGAPCPAEDAALGPFCDHAGRVSGVWAMVDTVHGVPPREADVIRDEPVLQKSPGRSLVVALEGERLWFRLVTCGMCRRVMGYAFVGDLPRLSDEQLRAIETRLGLPPSTPPLRTAKEWRDFYASHPLPRAGDGGA